MKLKHAPLLVLLLFATPLYAEETLPKAVENSFKSSYGLLTVTTQSTNGSSSPGYCGAFIADEKRKLIITAHHCLPDYAAQIHNSVITFGDQPATYIASIPEADLALFHIPSIPDDMRELKTAHSAMNEAVYSKSLQYTSTYDEDQSEKFATMGDMEALVEYSGTITAIGIARVFEMTMLLGKPSTFTPRRTSYVLLRSSMTVEKGFSGSPAYNAKGEAVGVISGISSAGFSVLSGSENFAELLKLYKE